MREAQQVSVWLEVHRGRAPLIVSFPHTGTGIPGEIEARLVSPWLGRRDADWWVHRLYGGGDEAAAEKGRDAMPNSADEAADNIPRALDIARALDATTIRTSISRTVIDVNRDPSGASLYPGQATTSLCPLATFDGEPLYRPAQEPDAAEISARRACYFEPYHAALRAEIERLRALHGAVALYDAHSIRSRIPRLFDGLLPHFNIGTNDGETCATALTNAVERACEHPGLTRVTNGRFKGGWTVRHHGDPARGIHAIQMELACRSYLDEPEPITPGNWPPAYDPARAAPVRAVLGRVLRECLHFARSRSGVEK